MHFWSRHSSSYIFDLPDTQKRLKLRERVKINSCTNNNASLVGYVYQVWDSLGTTALGWWPCDTSFSILFAGNNAPKTLMEYSILTKNKAVGIKKNMMNAAVIEIYPNPAHQSQTLTIKCDKVSNCKVELYDMMGRFIKTVHKGKTDTERTEIVHNVEQMPNSLYIYVITIDDIVLSKKFVKE